MDPLLSFSMCLPSYLLQCRKETISVMCSLQCIGQGDRFLNCLLYTTAAVAGLNFQLDVFTSRESLSQQRFKSEPSFHLPSEICVLALRCGLD